MILVLASFTQALTLTDNLISYYKTDSSPTVYDDATGNYPLTLYNTTIMTVNGVINQAQYVNQNKQRMTNNSFKGLSNGTTPTFTINFWLKQNATSYSNSMGLFGIGITGGSCTGDYYTLELATDSTLHSHTCGGGGADSGVGGASFGYTVPIGEIWQMYTLVKINDTNMSLYVNGSWYSALNSKFGEGVSGIANGFSLFSQWNLISNTDTASKTALDEVGLWNRTLSESEIMTLYNGGEGLTYPFFILDHNETRLYQTPIDLTDDNGFGVGVNVTYFVNSSNFSQSSIYLNWTVENGQSYWTFINATPQPRYMNKSFYLNSSRNFSFHLDDNQIYPGTHNIDDDVFENTPHNTLTLTTLDYIKTKFVPIRNDTQFNIFEAMVNTSGVCRAFYCNSSYTSGNPTTNANCYEYGDFQSQVFNHSVNNSYHNIVRFLISGGTIGTVKVTNTSYFLIKGTVGGGCAVGYINATTTSDTTQTSTNLGSSWTNQIYTADMHIHQYNANDNLSYQVCQSASGITFCSDFYRDTLNITPQPPFPPVITSPVANITDLLWVNFTSAVPYDNTSSIVGYKVFLTFPNLTINRTLENFTTQTSLFYNITNQTPYGECFAVLVNSSANNSRYVLEYSDVVCNNAPTPSAEALNTQLLSDINRSLSSIRSTQSQDSEVNRMTGLYILIIALIGLSFLMKSEALKWLTVMMAVVVGLYHVTNLPGQQVIGLLIIGVGCVLAVIPVKEETGTLYDER